MKLTTTGYGHSSNFLFFYIHYVHTWTSFLLCIFFSIYTALLAFNRGQRSFFILSDWESSFLLGDSWARVKALFGKLVLFPCCFWGVEFWRDYASRVGDKRTDWKGNGPVVRETGIISCMGWHGEAYEGSSEEACFVDEGSGKV
jgi:hypothetical protein